MQKDSSNAPDLLEVRLRHSYARSIIDGFQREMPSLTPIWGQIADAIADAGNLANEVSRLRTALHESQLNLANMLAAVQATLAAHADGETDPLFYIRDELESHRPSCEVERS